MALPMAPTKLPQRRNVVAAAETWLDCHSRHYSVSRLSKFVVLFVETTVFGKSLAMVTSFAFPTVILGGAA